MSTAKLPYKYATDGISNTFGLTPQSLGHSVDERATNLTALVDGYMHNQGMHLNLNVLNRETLIDAQKHPEAYGDLVIRVSGYSIRFVNLTKKQQDDIIARTLHGTI